MDAWWVLALGGLGAVVGAVLARLRAARRAGVAEGQRQTQDAQRAAAAAHRARLEQADVETAREFLEARTANAEEHEQLVNEAAADPMAGAAELRRLTAEPWAPPHPGGEPEDRG